MQSKATTTTSEKNTWEPKPEAT